LINFPALLLCWFSSIYQRAKYASDDGIKRMTGKSPLSLANATNSYPSLYTLGCSGSAGAFSGAVITCLRPFELRVGLGSFTQLAT
jgi:solute carrier family 25 carnitine/acylcarnitine transporter 20/29